MQKLTLVISLLLVNLLLNQTTYCQENQQNSNDSTKIKETQIDEIVIEATKTLSFSNTSVIATIEQKDIQFAPVNNLQDLLEYLQGVDLRTRGTEGIQADVSIRGGTFDQTVVLLNGINFTDPQTGHHSLNLPIDVSLIERIEILQGIDSWVAGVPTFCGAINIITKNPATNKFISPYFNYGMHDFYKLGISAGGNLIIPEIKAIANVNMSKTNGYAPNTDFNIANGFALLNYQNDKVGNFELQFGTLAKEFGANSYYSIVYREQYEAFRSSLASLKYNNNFDGFGQNEKINLNSSIYYRQHNDRFELFRWEKPDSYSGHNFHQTDIWGINASIDYKWKLGFTTVGGDFRSENIKSTNLGDSLENPIPVPNENNIFYKKSKLRLHQDAYLKHHFSAKSWDLQLGIMASGSNFSESNSNDNFSFRLISGGNLRYLLNEKSNILLTVQQGYRLPTFTDLFYTSASQIGNIDLKPESSLNSELNYNWSNQKFTFRTNIFHRFGYQIIDWVRLPSETIWRAKNFTDVTTVGFGVSANYNFDNSDFNSNFMKTVKKFLRKISINYSYLDVKKALADNFVSLYATDFLRHQLNFSILHRIFRTQNSSNEISANWQFRFQSRAGNFTNESGAMEKYPAIFLCDLKLVWQSRYFDLFIEGTNLFDSDYVDIANLPQSGIWLKSGVTVKI